MLCNAFVIRLHRLLGLGAMSAVKEIHRTMLFPSFPEDLRPKCP